MEVYNELLQDGYGEVLTESLTEALSETFRITNPMTNPCYHQHIHPIIVILAMFTYIINHI